MASETCTRVISAGKLAGRVGSLGWIEKEKKSIKNYEAINAQQSLARSCNLGRPSCSRRPNGKSMQTADSFLLFPTCPLVRLVRARLCQMTNRRGQRGGRKIKPFSSRFRASQQEVIRDMQRDGRTRRLSRSPLSRRHQGGRQS